MELEHKLNLIKIRIEQLISENKRLINENNQLVDDSLRLRSQLEDSRKIINDLENKALNLQFNNSIENDEKNKLKTVIEELIIEIDKGIELLKS